MGWWGARVTPRSFDLNPRIEGSFLGYANCGHSRLVLMGETTYEEQTPSLSLDCAAESQRCVADR